MTDHQKDKFGRAADSKRLWSFGSKEWPIILNGVRSELRQAYTDLSNVRDELRSEKQLAELAKESSAKSTERLLAEQALSGELSQQFGNAKTSLEKSQETVGQLENKLARTELETERIKAELSKTQADLARVQFEQAREKDEHTKTRTIVTLLREWIHTTHRVDIPARNGTIKNILAGMKRLLILALPLIPLCLNAQFPPPVFRNSWSTNVPPRPVEGFNNLSVTNLGSGTNWQFYNVGPFTVARLTDVSNIAGGAGLTFSDLVWTNDQGIPHIVPAITNIGWTDTNTFITRNLGGALFEQDANLGVGYQTGNKYSNGDRNSMFGNLSGSEITIGDLNSGFGYVVMQWAVQADGNSAFGARAMQFLTNGINNTAMGLESMQDIGNGTDNCAFGYDCLDNAIGVFGCSGFGSESLHGHISGNYVTGYGYRTGAFSESRPFNTFIGAQADLNSFNPAFTNSTALGFNAKVYDNNLAVIGNAFVSIAGNSNFFLGATGMLRGLVVTQDIRFLGHNSTSNFVWTCTNTATGEGEWRSASGGSGLTTNENQFLGVPLSIKSGAQMTNVTFWESNALLPALIATNQPGGTIDLVTMLTTNAAGLRVTSNGAVVVRGVIGSTTNYFEVRNSNNITPIFAVTHSNTVRIVTPNSGAAEAGGIIFDSEQGFTQTPVHFFVGGAKSGSWRADSSGNQVISGNGVGDLFFCTDGGSGEVHFQQATVGTLWSLFPSASVAAWHGGTVRRGQITNVWDIFCRSNMTWIERSGSDVVSLQSTSGMSSYTMFLPITNGLPGQVLYNVGGGELSWKDDSTSPSPGLTTNANQFLGVPLSIISGAFQTNFNGWLPGTNHGNFRVEGDFTVTSGDSFFGGHLFPETDNNFSVGSISPAFRGYYARSEGLNLVDTADGDNRLRITAAASMLANYDLIFPDAQGADGQVITNNGSGTLGWWTPVSSAGLTTNANQFGAQVTLTIKSGALLTNTLFYPSNLTGPAIIATATTAQVTNLVEWRGTNSTIPISISSNANAIVYGRLDMSNAVAFRTNNIDLRLPVYQAFTNALQTNLVLQLTNVYEGVTHRIDAYGAGRLGNGRTNAWQLFCTVPANHFIYWPPGTTNGNFDVLVNSNQIVSFTFMGGLGSTNVLAAYRVLEGIGAN